MNTVWLTIMMHKFYLDSLSAEDTDLSLWLHIQSNVQDQMVSTELQLGVSTIPYLFPRHLLIKRCRWECPAEGRSPWVRDVGAQKGDPGTSPSAPTQAMKPPVNTGCMSLCGCALVGLKLPYSQASSTSWKQPTDSGGSRRFLLAYLQSPVFLSSQTGTIYPPSWWMLTH